jgi:hypothetical protein
MVSTKYLRYRLKEFVWSKGRILKEITGIDFITDEDRIEVEAWPDSDILIIANNFYRKDTDEYICPWCIIFKHRYLDNGCEYCTYGNRHGICRLEEDNVYERILFSLFRQKIIMALPLGDQGISDVPEIKSAALYFVKELHLMARKTYRFKISEEKKMSNLGIKTIVDKSRATEDAGIGSNISAFPKDSLHYEKYSRPENTEDVRLVNPRDLSDYSREDIICSSNGVRLISKTEIYMDASGNLKSESIFTVSSPSKRDFSTTDISRALNMYNRRL